MRKNRVLIFLLVIAVVLGFVFYKISNGEEYLTFDKVKEQVISKCEDNQYDDASKDIEKELNDNPNIADKSDEREELKKMNERLLKVKGIQPQTKEDEENIKKIKLFYVKGGDDNFNGAKLELEESLKLYPTNKELLTLKSILEEEGLDIEVEKPKTKPSPPVRNPQPIPVVTNENERQKTKEIEKQEIPKQKEETQPLKINTGFKRISGQNKVEWSKILADNAESIRIVYTVKGIGVLVDEIVTGRTSHIYDPGTSRAHGRSTKVELFIDYGYKKVNESGTIVLDNQFFVCSAN